MPTSGGSLPPATAVPCRAEGPGHPAGGAGENDRTRTAAAAPEPAGDRAGATDHLIYAIKKKRDWNEEAARKQLVKFFEAWGPKDEFTLAGRRKLSSVLFS